MIETSAPLQANVAGAVVMLAALAAVFALKHLVADFFLQTNWMARGKEAAAGWSMPLLAHVGCHGVLTLLIVLAVAPRLWWLAPIDVAIHTIVDRGKSLIAQRGAWRFDQPQFWWLLGFDQFLHQLTNIGLATAIVIL